MIGNKFAFTRGQTAKFARSLKLYTANILSYFPLMRRRIYPVASTVENGIMEISIRSNNVFLSVIHVLLSPDANVLWTFWSEEMTMKSPLRFRVICPWLRPDIVS